MTGLNVNDENTIFHIKSNGKEMCEYYSIMGIRENAHLYIISHKKCIQKGILSQIFQYFYFHCYSFKRFKEKKKNYYF